MNTLITKKFEAILAKNDIAREIRNFRQYGQPINSLAIEWCLEQLESYMGEANQPSIKDIIECEEYSL